MKKDKEQVTENKKRSDAVRKFLNNAIKSGGFFRITHHSDFSAGRTCDAVDNLLKPFRHFVTVGSFAALTAHTGRHVFDNNNAAAHVGGKGREPLLYHTFAHKTDHGFLTEQYPQWSYGKYTVKPKTCKSHHNFQSKGVLI
jgi:hypothetical protein